MMKVWLRNPSRTVELEGPRSVAAVLAALEINPETVLVIRDGALLTRDATVPDDAEIELRPVISGGAGGPRCKRCGQPAVLEVPRHRAAYCAEDLIDHVRAQVRSAIDHHRMLSYRDRVLVAVSGGKDSLALWDALLDMGYRAAGLYLGLGIGEYSQRSAEIVRAFADQRGAHLHEVDLAAEQGFDIPTAAGAQSRSACGVCGLSKRYVFNRVALEHGYDVMATGHNLDDEAATLLGNVLRWQTPFLARQSPVLPAEESGMVRKIKPLYRLGEREMAAYCVVKGIDYVVEECPLVGGNTVHRYKDALNELERSAPGTKAQFLFGFLDRVRDAHFADADEGGGEALVACAQCGMPTSPPRGGQEPQAPVCAFCRTRGRILGVVGEQRA